MSVEMLRDPVSKPQEFILGVERFRQRNVSPIDLSEFGRAISTEGKIGVFDDVLPIHDGFYINLDDYAQRLSLGNLPNRVSFDVQSGLNVGRENSRNKVFFGKLKLHHFGKGQEDENYQVAVKPFHGLIKNQHLGQEIGMLTELQKLGVDTPIILGLIKSQSSNYLITHFISEALSLDSIDWPNLHPDIRDAVVKRGIKNLLEIHRHGIFHGDADPRNLIIQPNNDAVWHVDLEHAVRAQNPLSVLQSIKSDLRDYYAGICKLTSTKPTYSDMVVVLLEPYERMLLQYRGLLDKDTKILDRITSMFSLICEEFEREYSGEPINQYERDIKLSSLNIGHVAITETFSKSA